MHIEPGLIPEAKIVQMKANWDIYEPAIRL